MMRPLSVRALKSKRNFKKSSSVGLSSFVPQKQLKNKKKSYVDANEESSQQIKCNIPKSFARSQVTKQEVLKNVR